MVYNSDQKKVLLLDGQIFQTDAWDRGMGKYMLQLMKQLSELQPPHLELKVLFNSQISTDSARFDTIHYLCPNFEHAFADLPYAKDKNTTSAQYKTALDKYIHDSEIDAANLIYMITTLFSFDIFAEYPTHADEKVMIFYDLIPLMQWKDLGGYFPPHLYMGRFERIYEADVIYCISQTTQADIINTFGIDREKTVNINGGFTEHHLEAIKPASFIVPDEYILFPTGNLPHKNNQLVFKSFKEVLKTRGDIHLLVTSKFSDEARTELLKFCDTNVIFTQNVSDEELQYLYKNAAMVLFASKYEGLGLPVLDAVFHNKPVVASGISVFKEMSEEAFFYFNVNDYVSASRAMIEALDINIFKKKKLHYQEILNKYDWKNVGSAVYDKMLARFVDVKEKSGEVYIERQSRIAIISLNPGINGPIGRLAERLYVHISKSAKISYFFDSCGMNHREMERPTFLDYLNDVKAYDLSRLTINEYRRYDYVFYLVDAKALSSKMSQYIASLPGYVIVDSSVDKSSIIYKATTVNSLGILPVNTDTNDVLKVTGDYMRSVVTGDVAHNETIRIMKSYIPNRFKLAYLKRNVS